MEVKYKLNNNWKNYLIAFLVIAFAASLRIWPLQSLGLRTVWVTFYPSVMLVAVFGGLYAGLLATALSCSTALFLWPLFVNKPFINDFGDYLGMSVFIFTCVMMSVVSELILRARQKIKQANSLLESVNRDLELEVSSRRNAENELKAHKDKLEETVNERTIQLKNANEILSKSEERFRSTLDCMLEGCQILGFDLRYIYINDAADIHNRRPKEQLLGNRYEDMWPGIEKTHVYEVIKSCLESRIAQQMENEFTFPNGSRGWFELSIQPVPEGVFILSNDITPRKMIENDLRNLNIELEKRVFDRTAQLAEINNELESFTYSVSHDLRAPLRHINGFIDLLLRSNDNNLNDKGKRYLDIISSSSKQMGQLIDDLLNFSRTGRASLQIRDIDTNKLVTQVINNLIDSSSGNITWSVSDLPDIIGDPSLLEIVFINLIGNAVKYSARVKNPCIEIGFTRNDISQFIFFVKDNGAGFDMNYSDKLFGVFQRLHSSDEYEGTGVGLATVRRIIQKHGGETWAEGEVGKGAVFFFSIPVVPETAFITS